MGVKYGFVARLEGCRDDAHFLVFAGGHARHNLLQERLANRLALRWTHEGQRHDQGGKN